MLECERCLLYRLHRTVLNVMTAPFFMRSNLGSMRMRSLCTRAELTSHTHSHLRSLPCLTAFMPDYTATHRMGVWTMQTS